MKKQKHKAVIEKIFACFGFGVFAAIVLILAAYWLPYLPVRKSKNAIASSADSMSGWAWSSTIGWISFNSANCDSNGDGFSDSDNYPCEIGKPVAPYGVNLNLATGEIEDGSYAWSSSAGWVNFNPLGETPDLSVGSDLYNYPVRLDLESGELRGWARIIAISGEGGWIRFHADPDDPVQYGVEIASGEDRCTDDGKIQLEGYAWSDEFGWISLGGIAQNGSEYGAYIGAVPEIPVNVNAVASISSGCSAISVSWEYNATGQTGFEIQRKSTLSGWTLVGSVEPDSRGYVDSGLNIGMKYFYQVRALGECENSNWAASGSVFTDSICAISSVSAKGQCPESVIVSWSAPAAALGADLSYAIERKETKDENGNPVTSDWVSSSNGSCSASPAPPSCADIVPSSGAKKTYIYKVTAIDLVSGNQASSESNEVVPCPPAPSWIEVNPR